jgi:hypothetical protein
MTRAKTPRPSRFFFDEPPELRAAQLRLLRDDIGASSYRAPGELSIWIAPTRPSR